MQKYTERLQKKVVKIRHGVKHLSDYQQPHFRVTCDPLPDDEMVRLLCGFHYHSESAAYNAGLIIQEHAGHGSHVEMWMGGVTGTHCPIQGEIDPAQRDIMETTLHEVVNGLNEENVCYSCDKLRDLYNIAYLHGQASVMMNMN